jgi:hypothetical protein
LRRRQIDDLSGRLGRIQAGFVPAPVMLLDGRVLRRPVPVRTAIASNPGIRAHRSLTSATTPD